MINIILVLAIIASILLIGLVRPLMACVRVGLLATFSDFVVFEILFKPIEKTYLSLVLLKLEIELTMNIRNSFRLVSWEVAVRNLLVLIYVNIR